MAAIYFPFAVHPSCLDYSEELARKILSAVFWQCINCKTCSVCDEADPLEDVRQLTLTDRIDSDS